MSEIEALLNFYGALDRAVEAEVVDADDLAPLLGPYGQGAAGWYRNQYLPWLAAAPERAEQRSRHAAKAKGRDLTEPAMAYAAEPDSAAEPERSMPAAERPTLSPLAQDISDALSAFEPRPLEGRMGARRLLAVAAAAQALPEHFGPGGTHADIANAPLVFQHPDVSGDPNARAQRLHQRVAGTFKEMSVPAWRAVLEPSLEDGSLPPEFKKQLDAPPCTGRLIMRPDPEGTDLDPCTVLEASFTTGVGDITFDEAKNYLEPANWALVPDSLWCRMEKVPTPLPRNSWRYHETVATSCPPDSALWSVSTDLRFWFSHPAINEARVEYDFPPDLPTQGRDIEVDEGSLRIIELPDTSLQVITTKRVRFAGAFDGAGLAMFMCAIGYSSALEDMVFSASKSPNPYPFPVQFSQGGTMSAQPRAKQTTTTTSASATTPPSAKAETLDDVVKETTEFVASYVKDVADTCTESLKKVQAGTYKVEDAWADGIKMWSTYMNGMTKALDLGTRTAKNLADNPPPAGGTPTGEET